MFKEVLKVPFQAYLFSIPILFDEAVYIKTQKHQKTFKGSQPRKSSNTTLKTFRQPTKKEDLCFNLTQRRGAPREEAVEENHQSDRRPQRLRTLANSQQLTKEKQQASESKMMNSTRRISSTSTHRSSTDAENSAMLVKTKQLPQAQRVSHVLVQVSSTENSNGLNLISHHQGSNGGCPNIISPHHDHFHSCSSTSNKATMVSTKRKRHSKRNTAVTTVEPPPTKSKCI